MRKSGAAERIEEVGSPPLEAEERAGIGPFISFRSCGLIPQSLPSSTAVELTFEPGTLPGGWVIFSALLTCPAQYRIFHLDYTLANGAEGKQEIPLTIESGVPFRAMLKLPKNIVALRLVPYSDEGQATFSDVRIKKLGSLQLLFEILKKQFGPIITKPALVLAKVRKVLAVFRSGGIEGLRLRAVGGDFTRNYSLWVERFDTLTAEDRLAIQEELAKLKYQPQISIILPVYNTPQEWLKRAIESAQNQLYTNWELCIADDASTEPELSDMLQGYAALDPRIKITFRKENGHISAATNSALELAEGEFVAFLDHDDELREHALFHIACALNQNPKLNLIYSDEDMINEAGLRFNPHFKSDLNLALLDAQNYICHLAVYRRRVVEKLGGLRTGVEGAQDWDLALRVIDSVPHETVAHLPRVLYHWRAIRGSTASSTSFKPYVLEAQARVVREHLERRGVEGAKVEILTDISHIRVRYPVPNPEPLVTVVIPTRDQVELLKRVVDGVLNRTSYQNLEIIIVDNGSRERETEEYLKRVVSDSRVRVMRDDREFNFSRLNNDAAREARGEHLCFLNNDIEVRGAGWLSEMISYAVQPGVGAVGARLLYPNDLLQHAGVILGINGVAGHNHKGLPRSEPGYFNRAVLPQDLSAVTAACMVVSREAFQKAGGFDERELAIAFNDTDLCLKLRELGLRIVYTPYAELYHHESMSRGYENTSEKYERFEGEVAAMKERWGRKLESDPYYNPNLTLVREDFSFAFPPRG